MAAQTKGPGVAWALNLYTSGKVVPMHTEGPVGTGLAGSSQRQADGLELICILSVSCPGRE